MIFLRLLSSYLGYLENTNILRLLSFTYLTYKLYIVLRLLTLLMKLHFDIAFLFSAFGYSKDEPNNMQLEDSHLEHQEISLEIPDSVFPLPPRPRDHASYHST